MCRRFITHLHQEILTEGERSSRVAGALSRRPFQLEHLGVEHQVNFFMGCDCHIEKWWRWVKRLYKVKEPLGRNENALPLQIVAAFVTDLLLRVFKHGGGFKGTLYEFVRRCREQSLTPFNRLGRALGDALSAASKLLEITQASPQEQS